LRLLALIGLVQEEPDRRRHQYDIGETDDQRVPAGKRRALRGRALPDAARCVHRSPGRSTGRAADIAGSRSAAVSGADAGIATPGPPPMLAPPEAERPGR